MSRTKIDWVPTLFLTLTPIAAAILLPVYFYLFDASWQIWLLTAVFWFGTSLSITAGYHRLFAHRAFDAKPWFRFLTLLFGAAAFQNSALKWCSEHRQHHKKVDSDIDPYSISKGAFFAHIGWMLVKNPACDVPPAPDLQKDKMVAFQDKYYYSIAILSCFALPALCGWMLGDIFGGFVLAGVARLVGVHHSTFFINSLAHIWGSQPYTSKNSARDNLILAFFTNGEGYHNYHHYFEGDYRNGVKWYHWDPTKWIIAVLSWFGQTYRLQKVPPQRILKAKMQRQLEILKQRGVNTSQLDQIRARFDGAQRRLNELKKEYGQRKKLLKIESREKYLHLKAEVKLAHIECRKSLQQWSACVALLNRVPA